jgi:hypothetical protein
MSQSADSLQVMELPAPTLILQSEELVQVMLAASVVFTSQVDESSQVMVPPLELVLQSELSWQSRLTSAVP